jgi:hypothetical protein
MPKISAIEARRAKLIGEAAAKISRILEEHFDEMGWSEEERNRRVSGAGVRIAEAVARHAKSA